ncbi:MAG: hypothetical protein R3272_00315 [Candidatus Promineifilaceae bacterium]|nr:hypothetical protein [Candidatus Promineifilaceae bacterium]
MVDVYDPDDDDIEDEEPLDLEPNAAPEPVGVYERPESTGASTSWVMGIVGILLVIALILVVLFVIL